MASAQTAAPTDNFRALWPVGVYDPKLVPAIEKEWARTRASETQGKAASKPGTKPANKPANKPAGKPARSRR